MNQSKKARRRPEEHQNTRQTRIDSIKRKVREEGASADDYNFCEQCEKLFDSSEQLISHKRRRHAETQTDGRYA